MEMMFIQAKIDNYRNQGRIWDKTIEQMNREELQEYYNYCSNRILEIQNFIHREIYPVKEFFPQSQLICITEDLIFLHFQVLNAKKVLDQATS